MMESRKVPKIIRTRVGRRSVFGISVHLCGGSHLSSAGRKKSSLDHKAEGAGMRFSSQKALQTLLPALKSSAKCFSAPLVTVTARNRSTKSLCFGGHHKSQ
jgi:hypothetical protein